MPTQTIGHSLVVLLIVSLIVWRANERERTLN